MNLNTKDYFQFFIETVSFDEVFEFVIQAKKHYPYLLEGVQIESFCKKISSLATFVTVRNESDKLIGLIAFYMNNSNFLYITLACVLKEYQGKKLFKKMFFLLETKAKCQNYPLVQLEVNKTNEKVKALYEHSGFIQILEKDESLIMQKKINICEVSEYRGGGYIKLS
ncbi:GNAT family N-acetyltransferase [Treponema brennaborense]|uniref:GCN5-related N-acetyltransferase n=1 Tax=Treponema brennaborense (strain DSM 12168 / CIP 105900 / DD5/3) TaxID=906968 RepID=F4LID5_TREBD|nr:GNAT family N-acetyltransferase [Treponema brennaborense]AEE16176.1 GCN5-related N-acetyltransferase [Treponema brennaborense DSM 12168]